MASAAPETIVALIGPTVQRYLTEPLPAAVAELSPTAERA
jgi:hypothetical protein